MPASIVSFLEILRIVVSVVVAFGLVILFHEVGHFVMGKIAGVDCPEFAFGMGPELFGFDYHGTRYRVCLFPIGGYVKMVGEDEELEEGQDITRSVQHKHPLMKIGIFFAGPFMNYVLAVLLFSVAFFIWGIPREIPDWVLTQPTNSVVVKFVDVRKEAGRVGIHIGDVITEIEGRRITQVTQVTGTMWKSPDKPVHIKINRNGKMTPFTVTPRLNKTTGQGMIGVVLGPPQPRQVRSVAKGSPADRAGIRPGDFLLDVDGHEIADNDFKIKARTSVALIAEKGGQPRSVDITANRSGADSGLLFQPRFQRIGPFSSIGLGVRESVGALGSVVMSFKWIFQRKVGRDDMAGPVGIIQYMADFARRDILDFIRFIALISMTLAIVNLFPIPALDGSRIIFSLIELVMGKPIDPRREGMVHYVGFILLMALIALITFNDVLQLVRK